MPTKPEGLETITADQLDTVSGGVTRSSKNDEITSALTEITSSIKNLANNQNQGMDPMNMILMMMMMGGFGGGGGGGVIAAPGAAAPPVINVDTAVAGGGRGGCRRGGKKGW